MSLLLKNIALTGCVLLSLKSHRSWAQERQLFLGSVEFKFSPKNETAPSCALCLKGESECLAISPEGRFEGIVDPGEKFLSSIKCGDDVYLPQRDLAILVDNRPKVATYAGRLYLKLKRTSSGNFFQLTEIKDLLFDDTIENYNQTGKNSGLQYAKAFEPISDDPTDLKFKGIPIPEDEDTYLRNKRENLYATFGLVLPMSHFNASDAPLTTSQETNRGPILGVGVEGGALKPILKHRAMYGFNFRYLNYNLLGKNRPSSIATAETALTYQHYVTGVIGDGVFFRADLGTPWARLTDANSSTYSSKVLVDGIGFLLGLGFSKPIEPSTRFYALAGLSIQSIDLKNKMSTPEQHITLQTKSGLFVVGYLF